MFNRTKQTIKKFEKKAPALKYLKYRCVKCAFMQKIEYAQVVSGRCISVGGRGNTRSILVRNKKYGIEVRYFLNNPRLILFKLRRGWDSNPWIFLNIIGLASQRLRPLSHLRKIIQP